MSKQLNANQSIEKGIRIIEVLAHSAGPLRLSQVAAAVDMPASTVLRMLTALIGCGYAYQEEGELKRYGLTMRFAYIGQMVAEHFSIRDIAHEHLARLAQETGESCCLAVQDGERVRYMDVVEAGQGLIAIRQRVGGTAMMHCTGSGKLFLSQYDEAALEAFVRAGNLRPLTPRTITQADALRGELERVRAQGYATDDEECETGMRCLAAPIRDAGGRIVAVLSLSGPVSRMDGERMESALLPAVQRAAEAISERVGGVQAG